MEGIISSAGCVTGLFYILVILFSKPKKTNSIILLLFILTLCLSLVPVLLNMLFYFPPFWLNTSFGLLWGPLLYFYIVSLLKEKVNFKYLIFHLMPFLVFFTLTVFFRYDILPKPPNADFPPQFGNTNSTLVFTIIQNVSLFGYSLVTLYILDKHKKNIQNHFSYTDARLTIRWSYVIILFFVSAYLIVAIDDKQGKYTLLAIAFDSGFNSKSGFNKNFKLETGMTPFEFRKSIITFKSSA